MYTLTIQTKTADDRTEEDFYFATAQEAYAKVAEVATALATAPTDVLKTFNVSRSRGTLPVDVNI